jgi:hypothetical protein
VGFTTEGIFDMGLLKSLVKTSIKIVAAPIHIPISIAKELKKPPQYNWWYHSGGQEEDTHEQEERDSAKVE